MVIKLVDIHVDVKIEKIEPVEMEFPITNKFFNFNPTEQSF